jgi:two-component system sensor histidine kinase GlrK
MVHDEHLAFEQMLVHNLKAPLTGIMASLEMLHEGDLGALTASQRDAIAAMQQQSADLVQMIDQLLDVGHVGSPAFPVQCAPIDPSGILAGVCAAWTGRLPRLTSTVASDARVVFADADLLRRVFDNLLMNVAVHAGSDAPVTIRAQRLDDFVQFSVSDDGPGIVGSEAERIFDPFVTLNRTGARRTHGLGLAFCRAAVTAMGGTVELAPSDHGATFDVRLPVADVRAREVAEPGP